MITIPDNFDGESRRRMLRMLRANPSLLQTEAMAGEVQWILEAALAHTETCYAVTKGPNSAGAVHEAATPASQCRLSAAKLWAIATAFSGQRNATLNTTTLIDARNALMAASGELERLALPNRFSVLVEDGEEPIHLGSYYTPEEAWKELTEAGAVQPKPGQKLRMHANAFCGTVISTFVKPGEISDVWETPDADVTSQA